MPGIEGEAIAPIIASVASVTFSCSDSNQRSRIGVAAPVRISIAFCPSGYQLAKLLPSLASSGDSRDERTTGWEASESGSA